MTIWQVAYKERFCLMVHKSIPWKKPLRYVVISVRWVWSFKKHILPIRIFNLRRKKNTKQKHRYAAMPYINPLTKKPNKLFHLSTYHLSIYLFEHVYPFRCLIHKNDGRFCFSCHLKQASNLGVEKLDILTEIKSTAWRLYLYLRGICTKRKHWEIQKNTLFEKTTYGSWSV